MDGNWYEQLELGFLRKCAEDGCTVEEAMERSRWLGEQDPNMRVKTANILTEFGGTALRYGLALPAVLAVGGLAAAYPTGRWLGHTAAKNLYPAISMREIQQMEKLRQLQNSTEKLRKLTQELETEQKDERKPDETQTQNFNIY